MKFGIVQHFQFETERLPILEEILNTTAHVMFDFSGAHPKILLKEPNIWPDGRYDNFRDDHDFLYRNPGGTTEVLSPSGCFHGATELMSVETHASREDAARCIIAAAKPPKPTRMWLATIYQGGHSRVKSHERITCLGWSELVQRTINICQEADKKRFREDFEHAEFPHFDGSVHCGYRLESDHSEGFDDLHVSMIHIYHGK